MPHLGTFEAGTDFDLVLAVVDQDGSAIDLSSGSGAGYISRGQATYLTNDALSSLTSGGSATWVITKAESGNFPAGIFNVVAEFLTSASKTRIVRATFEIVRAPHVA